MDGKPQKRGATDAISTPAFRSINFSSVIHIIVSSIHFSVIDSLCLDGTFILLGAVYKYISGLACEVDLEYSTIPVCLLSGEFHLLKIDGLERWSTFDSVGLRPRRKHFSVHAEGHCQRNRLALQDLNPEDCLCASGPSRGFLRTMCGKMRRLAPFVLAVSCKDGGCAIQ